MSSPARDPRFDLRAGQPRKRRHYENEWRVRMVAKIFPCAFCGAPDARAKSHGAGCPKLPPVSKEELLRIALECEAGWRQDAH